MNQGEAASMEICLPALLHNIFLLTETQHSLKKETKSADHFQPKGTILNTTLP